MTQVSPWSSSMAYTLTWCSGSFLWWIHTRRIIEVVVSLQFMQLFVALTLSYAVCSPFSSGRKRWRTVAWGFLHNSHCVFCLQCRVIWPWQRQEKHIQLDMQNSCLSLMDFPRKFLHVKRLCCPLHNRHGLVSVGFLQDDSLSVVERVVPCCLLLSLSGLCLALSLGCFFLSLILSLLRLEHCVRKQDGWQRGLLLV